MTGVASAATAVAWGHIAAGTGQIRTAAWIDRFVERTQVDELIVTGAIYEHTARLRSFELAAQVLRERVEG